MSTKAQRKRQRLGNPNHQPRIPASRNSGCGLGRGRRIAMDFSHCDRVSTLHKQGQRRVQREEKEEEEEGHVTPTSFSAPSTLLLSTFLPLRVSVTTATTRRAVTQSVMTLSLLLSFFSFSFFSFFLEPKKKKEKKKKCF
jgi:hypothetical protein